MAQYPLINGVRYSFSSIELALDGATMIGFKELSYKAALDPGEVRGAAAQLIGRTRGQFSADGALTLYRQEFDELVARLGPGFMERSFPIAAMYADEGQPTVCDQLIGCRIKNVDKSSSEGSEALTVKLDLHIMLIRFNGVSP